MFHLLNQKLDISGKYYSFESEKVIVASGPWTNKLLGNTFKTDVYPSKGQIVKLRDPENKFTDLHLHGSCSVIKKKDDLIWIAATSEEKGFDKTITNQAKDFLIDSAKKMHNDIDQFPFHSQTACLRPVSYTHLTLPTKA